MFNERCADACVWEWHVVMFVIPGNGCNTHMHGNKNIMSIELMAKLAQVQLWHSDKCSDKLVEVKIQVVRVKIRPDVDMYYWFLLMNHIIIFVLFIFQGSIGDAKQSDPIESWTFGCSWRNP